MENFNDIRSCDLADHFSKAGIPYMVMKICGSGSAGH